MRAAFLTKKRRALMLASCNGTRNVTAQLILSYRLDVVNLMRTSRRLHWPLGFQTADRSACVRAQTRAPRRRS